MNNWIVIAVIAGLATAALHATVFNLSLVSVFMFYLAPLPLFVAGLGWGPVAAGAGGLIAAAAFAVGLGPKAGIFLLISTAIAPVLLSRLALMNRPADQGVELEGEASDQGVTWYPEGRLLLWSAVICGCLMTATIVFIGPDAASFEANIRQMAEKVLEQALKQQPELKADQFKPMIDMLVVAVPLISVGVLLVATMVNLLLAARILTASGKSLRPWAPFGQLAFPKSAGLALGAALIASFMPGTIGLIGKVFSAALGTAFIILGLAVVHGLTRNMGARPMILGTLYATLFVFTPLLILPLIGLAVADRILGLRQRMPPPGAGGST